MSASRVIERKTEIVLMEWLKISTSVELVRIQTDDIAFIAADGNYSDVYLTNGNPHKMTFKLHFFDEMLQRLADNMFIRVGKSLIVNRNYIYIINIVSKELVLSGNRLKADFKLKASKEALKQLKSLMEKEEGK